MTHCDHILALYKKGEKNRENNLALALRPAHGAKAAEDVKLRAKADSVRKSKTPLAGGKDSKWKCKLNGQVVLRESE